MGGKTSIMRRCECGAYRLATKVNDEWVWGSRCRACDKIARLYALLDAGVRVVTDESPSMLRERLESAERETEKLQALVAEMTKERRVAVKQHMDDLLEAKSTCPYSGLTCVIDDDDEEGVDPATAN